MKITDRFKRKETAYRYVDMGTVFKWRDRYYMATEEIEGYDNITNCVNLESGEYGNFDSDTMVEVLEAEMIVK